MRNYSVINDGIVVDEDSWVISLLRKPKGTNPEHAFLILEGCNTGGARTILRRYDFVADRQREGKAVIITRNFSVPVADARGTVLGVLLRDEEVYARTWGITRDQAQQLHQDALRDQGTPPDYQVSGNKSIVAKSFDAEGHSCFTWAREKLLNLHDDRMNDIKPKIGDFIAAQTSRYIKGETEPTSGPSCNVL